MFQRERIKRGMCPSWLTGVDSFRLEEREKVREMIVLCVRITMFSFFKNSEKKLK